MNIDLTRTEVHALIAACKDRKLVLDQSYIPNDPTPGAMSGYAMARSKIDQIETKLRELIDE
jgi:hypothetical protein